MPDCAGYILAPIHLSPHLDEVIEIIDMLGPIELNRTLQYSVFYDPKVDEIGENRNFYCLFYELCLKLAAQKNWRSFTCKYCPNFCIDSDSFAEKIPIQ